MTAMMGAALPSCSEDFLKEELDTEFSTQYFETPEGLEALSVSLYGNIRWWFGYEWAYGVTLYGADEFTVANDYTNEPWNNYDQRFGPVHATPALGAANNNCTAPGAVWGQMYYGIASCNTIIEKAPLIQDEEIRNRCLAHAYFLRGYNYYRLAAQYGGVVLQTEPAKGVVRNFTRSSEEDTWALVISDLRNAYNLFKGEEYTYGKGITWTKATAAHFLAKALLFRASERNSAWNAKYIDSDLDEAIEAAKYVISARKLEDNYSNLYANWTGVDCAIEMSDEILMAAGHNADNSTKGRFGNRTYNYFNPQFSNFSGGWTKRGVWIGGMDFQRCRPTEYTYSAFDHVNDARMWKTFRTVYGVNAIANKDDAAAHGVELGDPSIIMILNTKDDHTYDKYTFGAYVQKPTFTDDAGRLPEWKLGERPTQFSETKFASKKGQWVPSASVLYQNGQYVAPTFKSQPYCNFFAGINKTDDGTRTAEKGDAHRDVTMARVGETYLVLAELYVRKGDYATAQEYLNTIRRRAAWKAGENRSYYVDGSQAIESNGDYYTKNKEMYENSNLNINTYYLSNPDLAPTTASSESEMVLTGFPNNLPAEDEAILAKLGVSGQYERALNFILNERTRELLGEWQRWETLSRTNTLVKRAQTFNTEANVSGTSAAQNIKAHHVLRPIPQSFIDGLLNEDGSNLSADQKKAWQNPGY